MTLACYFSLSVFGSTGTKFGYKNFRSYFSKSEFYEDKCQNHDFKRIFISHVLVVSIAGKHGQTDQRPALSTESFRDDKSDCGRFAIKNNKI